MGKLSKRLVCIPPIKFDPDKFFKDGTTVWKGSAGGCGKNGDEEIDQRCLSIGTFDLSKTILDSGVSGNLVSGEERLAILRNEQSILLGGRVFLYLLLDFKLNGERSHLEWLRWKRGVRYVEFAGITLRSPGRGRFHPCLHRYNEKWTWTRFWLRLNCTDECLVPRLPVKS